MNSKLKSIAIFIVAGGVAAALGIVANVDPASPAVTAHDLSIAVASAFISGCARAAQLLIPAALATLKDALSADPTQ